MTDLMTITCFVCEEKLKRKGAIILSPPLYNPTMGEVVGKYHICFDCWGKVIYPIIKDQKAEIKFTKIKKEMEDEKGTTRESVSEVS